MPATRAASHHQTPAARLQGGGPNLDRGAHVCVAGQKSSLEQRLRVEGPNFGSLHRPGGHPPNAQTARPKVKLLKHPLNEKSGFRHWEWGSKQSTIRDRSITADYDSSFIQRVKSLHI